MNSMMSQIRTAIVLFVLLSAVTGFVYPLAVTGVAQGLFPAKANGSLILSRGRPVGSELVGQPFQDPKYFWGRLSATPDYPYNAASSSGSNLGPSNPVLVDAAKDRIEALHKVDPGNRAAVPVDLVTASASGLDPHISIAAARFQLARVARARALSEEEVGRLVDQFTEPRQLGLLGEPRVNVLALNLALDKLSASSKGNP
jgi:K+-transporting ATPase ATPase C chain